MFLPPALFYIMRLYENMMNSFTVLITTIQKSLLTLCLLILLSFCIIPNVYAVPSFDDRVAEDVINSAWKADNEWRVERQFRRNVDSSLSFQENIRNLFYPSGDWGQIRSILRVIWYWVLVAWIVYVWIQYLKDAEDESKAKDATMNLLMILAWAWIFFGAIWILESWLIVTNLTWSASLVEATEDNLFLQILLLLKVIAFFFAIIMVIWYGYQIMSTVDKEEKLEKWKDGILNVIVALVFIKAVDYVYFIAQSPDFKNQATDLIIDAWKIMVYIIWFAFVAFMLYAWFRLVTDWGKWEWFNEFKKIARGIFRWGIVIFLFLLIMYQVVQEFV